MSFSVIYVAAVIILMLAALMADRLRPGLVLFSAVVLLLCAHIISPKEALEGFSNKGMITVALLYLVSEGVRKSGILERILFAVLPKKNVSISRANLTFLPVVSAFSAFLNNTPVVVIFAPMIKNWAHKMKLPPTKFLIPLSYATIFGGVCTLIGTSTNLVVDGLMQDAGFRGMHMFELGRIGIFVCVAGLTYLIMVSRYLLPDVRRADAEVEEATTPPGLLRYEVMLSTRFPGLGKTLHEFDFYRHYAANVVAIRRAGQLVTGDWLNMKLTKEDTLIVDSDETFETLWRDSRVFWMINRMGGFEKPMGQRKRWAALILVIVMILGATFGEMPFIADHVPHLKLDMFFFACVTTVVMAWAGMFTTKRYTKYISWDVLITIACAFGISKAMINSGFADFIAQYIIQLSETARHSANGIYIMLAALYLITNIFTELITNNAAAALAFPLALSIARTLGVDPMPFFICVCIAASAAFSTPIGYQTNLIVQGVGGYKFTDFVKVGLPLNILTFLLAVFLIPLLY